MLEWLLKLGVTYLVIVIPRRPNLTMQNIGVALPILKVQRVVDEQVELTALFVLAIQALPDGLRPAVNIIVDGPHNEDLIKICQVSKADMLIVVHPVRPIVVEGIMQVTVSFTEEPANVG